MFQVGISRRGKLFRHEVSCLERSAVDADAAPIVERDVRLCSQASRQHGTGRSCARKSLLDVPPLLHCMINPKISLAEPTRTRTLLTFDGGICRILLFPEKIISRQGLLVTLSQYPWSSLRGSRSQNTCPCASALCASSQSPSPFFAKGMG